MPCISRYEVAEEKKAENHCREPPPGSCTPLLPTPVPRADIPQGGEHSEVLIDLQHGSVQQRVDVAQALQPSLQVLPLMAFQSPQLLRGQPSKASRGHRHWWEGWREVETQHGLPGQYTPQPQEQS